MVLYSSQVSQQMYMSQLAMSQQFQNAQMLAMQMGTIPFLPQMPQMSAAGAMGHIGQGGVYGEQIANRMVGAGRMMGTMGGLGLGVVGAMSGTPLDPFSAALSFGRAGYASAGVAGGVMGALGGALPFMAAGQLAGVYTGAFSGGMRDQAATNSMLRQNFNHMGGAGALGRGFSQQQMGQIGGMISAETRQSPFTSSQELNQLIQGGQEIGMFNAVRDVEAFSRKFKTMLDGLRKIQKELGGTLSEALNFTRGAQQVGIWTTGGRTAFASEMRDAMSSTGMDQNQLMGLAATGSMLSRATGGVGRQGAVGAIRTARQIGAAMSTGVISQELMSEATGGLTGQDAVQAFSAQALQMSDRFSRRAMGRYSLFALSNEQGTGLDEAELARFRAGDITVGSVRGAAHRNVNRMGRARALNQEGRLRGALMEEGGLSGQIGMMRLMLGERALDAGDDTAQLVMQRRFGLSREASQVWTGLMRNQSTIAGREDVDRYMGRAQVDRQQDIALNRSLEAIMTNFSHGIQEAGGVLSARRIGREFVTRVSSTMERAVNDALGVQAQAMNTNDLAAATRLGTGRATAADVARFQGMNRPAAARTDYAAMSMGNEMLHALGMHTTGRTLNDVMRGRGISNFNAMSMDRQGEEMRAMELAEAGVVTGRSANANLATLVGNQRQYNDIMAMSFGSGGRDRYFNAMRARGIDANLATAFAKQTGYDLGSNEYMRAPESNGGLRGLRANLPGVLARTGAGFVTGGVVGGTVGFLGGMPGAAVGSAVGAISGGVYEGISAIQQAMMTDRDRAIDFITRGGHAGRIARGIVGIGGRRGDNMGAGQQDLRMTREEAGHIADALHGENKPTREAVAKIVDSDTFRSDVRELQALDGPAAEAKVAQMDRRRAKMTEDEKKAYTVIMNELRKSKAILGKWGAGTQWSVSMEDQRRTEEYMKMMWGFGSQYSKVQTALGGDDGGAIADAFGGAAVAFAGGDPARVRGATQEIVRRLAGQTDEQRKRTNEVLGKSEVGRSMIMLEADRSNLVRQITGKGRRRTGAADAFLGQLTAGTLSQMDIEVDGQQIGTRNRAAIIARAFRQGGSAADDIAEQLTSGLSKAGIEDAASDVASVRKMMGGKGPINEKDLNELLDKMNTEGRDRVRTAASEAQMRANDPVGYESLQELKKIVQGIGALPKAPEVLQSYPKEGGGQS